MDFSAASTVGAATTSARASNVLTARGIGKTVKSGDADLVILRDIDLAVTQGEAVAIAGASGSGKSTLLAILAGLDTPTTGTVELDGQDIFAMDEDKRAELRGRACRLRLPVFPAAAVADRARERHAAAGAFR
jgi:predicted ABC-type transport system involved in lysophospholipase L1 biosynthesis ATPase subunit